jgi:hypothetical protein
MNFCDLPGVTGLEEVFEPLIGQFEPYAAVIQDYGSRLA